jgi:hypothetical protein
VSHSATTRVSPFPEIGIAWPPPGVLATADPADNDCTLLIDAIDPALAAIKQFAGTRQVFVHMGVGVGNPGTTLADLSNPTDGMADNLRRWQVNPPYLADAVQHGYFVVALNINNADPSVAITGLAQNDGVHVQVEARFPLGPSASQKAKQASAKVTELVQRADRLVVLNSVCQNPYAALINLVVAKSAFTAAYVLGYGLSSVQVAVPMNKKTALAHGTLPMIVPDLFPQDNN